jgi:hypothetical protein
MPQVAVSKLEQLFEQGEHFLVVPFDDSLANAAAWSLMNIIELGRASLTEAVTTQMKRAWTRCHARNLHRADNY